MTQDKVAKVATRQLNGVFLLNPRVEKKRLYKTMVESIGLWRRDVKNEKSRNKTNKFDYWRKKKLNRQ